MPAQVSFNALCPGMKKMCDGCLFEDREFNMKIRGFIIVTFTVFSVLYMRRLKTGQL